jgi:large repetitive protein
VRAILSFSVTLICLFVAGPVWSIPELGSAFAQERGAFVSFGWESAQALFHGGERIATGNALVPNSGELLHRKVPPFGVRPPFQDEGTASATVEGVVIDLRTRQVIGEARVILERGRVPFNYVGVREPELSVLTNQSGHFRVERVKPGEYRLSAAKRGYLSSAFGIVELEPGQVTRREISLDPMVRFNGRVLDESNHPVEGARVGVIINSRRSSLAPQPPSGNQPVSAGVTKRNGEFELFVAAEEESITLVALMRGYAPSRLGPLSVRADPPPKRSLVRLVRGLEATGQVVDEDGMAIRGAKISAHRLRVRETTLGLEDVEPQATSGPDGRFILRGLENGLYELTLTCARYATNSSEVEIEAKRTNRFVPIVLLREVEIKGRIVSTQSQPVSGAHILGIVPDVSKNETISGTSGEFTLHGFASGAQVALSGTAAGYEPADTIVRAPDNAVVLVLKQHGLLRGRVEDSETGAPLHEFRIRVAFGKAVSFRSEDGTFELKDLPSGRSTIVAQASGYQEAELTQTEIRVGEATEGVVFSLVRGLELTGRVVDTKTGARLPNITVSYRVTSREEPPPWAFDSNSQITDSDGTFKFDGLPKDKVTLIAGAPGYAETRRIVVTGEEGFVEIKLPKASSVVGRVVGSDASTPLPGSKVRLWSYSNRSGISVPADGNGAFSFEGLATGRYRLTAESSFGQSPPQEIVLESESQTRVDLIIKEGGTIRGKIMGLVPSELTVVQVVAQGQEGFRSMALTNPDGNYTIRGVPVGWVKVTAQSSSNRFISKSIELQQGVMDVALDIEFPRGSRLSGRVTSGGQPVANRSVSALSSVADSAAAFAQTDASGMYAIEGLSEGNYLVTLSGGGAKSLRISGDTVFDIEISSLSVSGRVLESNTAKPLSGVTVQVWRGSLAVDATSPVTDSQGRFSIGGLEPGQYQLTAHRPGFRVAAQSFSVPLISELVLDLTAAESTSIHVRDGITGLALRALTVDVFSDSQFFHLNIQLDESGNGELPQLPAGRYKLVVSSRGYASQSVIGWTVPSSPLELVFTPGGRLEIDVDSVHSGAKASLVDARGEPVRPALKEFSLMQPTALPNIAPGEYVLLVKLSEQTKKFRVSISEGQTTVLKLK